MTIQQDINKFHTYISQAHATLSQSKLDIEERQSTIAKCIYDLQNNQQIDIRNEHLGKFKELCSSQIEEYYKTIAIWGTEVDKYIHGKQFVNQFETSILLIVFGDVKAGKSAIGNFISGADFINTNMQDFYTKPTFYLYDSADKVKGTIEKKIIPEGYFVEDVIEATSTIQYFTLLDGLTWVDTPGIHSLTTENGELAKEYIKYADLILFLTPSNNPCKQDEGKQIKELIKKDKPLLVTITKSDTTVADVKDGQLIRVLKAKSPENRKQQEAFLVSEIEKMGGNNILSRNQYISLSTLLARKAIKDNDEDLFKQSNFPALYEQIGTIISKKSLDLKMKRPKDEVNFVIDEIIEGVNDRNIKGIDKIISNIKIVISEISKQKSLVSKSSIDIINNVKSELLPKLQQVLFISKNQGTLTNNTTTQTQINELVSTTIKSNINNTMSTLLSDFKCNSNSNISIQINSKYERKFTTIEYPSYEARTVTREADGFIENIQSLFFNKEFKEQRVTTTTFSKEIAIGDNFNDFINSSWQEISIQVEGSVNQEVNMVLNNYFGNLEIALNSMENQIISLKTKLMELKFKN